MLSIALIIIIILFCLTGCKKQDENTDISEKVNNEVEFLESQLVAIANGLNNISFSNYKFSTSEIKVQPSGQNNGNKSGESSQESDGSGGQKKEESSQKGASGQGEGEDSQSGNTISYSQIETQSILNIDSDKVNWIALQSIIETMYTTWPTIILDFNSLNADQNQIVSFGKELDLLSNNIKSKNKEESMATVTRLYSLLNDFAHKFSVRKNDLYDIKLYIINSYYFVTIQNFDEARNNIESAKVKAQSMIQNASNHDNVNNINKIYIQLNEMLNPINMQDKETYFMKYKYVMEELYIS